MLFYKIFFFSIRKMINDISTFLCHLYSSYSQYVSIPVFSITILRSGILSLPFPCFHASIFPSIIMVIQGLFLIRCPIHVFLLNLSIFHIDFWVFTLLRTSTYFTFSVHEMFSVLLQHHTSKASILAFSALSIV